MATNKYFPCPYCKKRLGRQALVEHIERNHIDLLSDEFTPLRIVFHVANRKDFNYRRPCRICGSPTSWDEKKGRYDLLCGKSSCHDEWVKRMSNAMGDKMGKFRPTESEDGLKKMLASRKISGTYKWSDGVEKTYTGSYERKALEFFDQVLNCKSEEVVSPGPVLHYELDGKTHSYITDIYYAPYNLVIEVKDGGNRPNKNPNYKETRRRQLAKEEFVINKTKYNYLRLTDNDFSQLLAVLADLKINSIEGNTKENRVIHVNEAMSAIGYAPMVGMGKDDAVIINYKKNTVFSGMSDDKDFAVSDGLFNSVFTRSAEGELVKNDKIMEHSTMTPYIVKGQKDRIIKTLNENLGKFVEPDFIYETVFGHKMYTSDQILFEKAAIEMDLSKIYKKK